MIERRARREFDASFKLEVVRMVKDRGLSIGDVCRRGFPPISRTHLKRLIMSQEVCHGNAKKIRCRVQAGSGTAGSVC
jgi:hypothetical protein